MLPSVLIAAALAAQGEAAFPDPTDVPLVVIDEDISVVAVEDTDDLYRPVLRPLPPELLKLVPLPARNPPAKPTPKRIPAPEIRRR